MNHPYDRIKQWIYKNAEFNYLLADFKPKRPLCIALQRVLSKFFEGYTMLKAGELWAQWNSLIQCQTLPHKNGI